MANIVLYSQATDTAYSYNPRPDEGVLRVQMTQDSPEYVFIRKLGICVLSARSRIMVADITN